MRGRLILNQWERENVKLRTLRSKLNKMAVTLGASNIKVLRLSQELDNLINIIQQRQSVSASSQEQSELMEEVVVDSEGLPN